MSADAKAKDAAVPAAGAGAAAATASANAAAPAAPAAAPAMAEETYDCTSCGRAIFRASDLIKTAPLWDLGEYKAATHWVKSAIDLHTLRRYDCSLHEGWYCCRFILMRMTVDKFGTGKTLLVYADSVEKHSVLAAKPKKTSGAAGTHKGQVKLGAADYDAVLSSAQNRDKLCWVKYGAIWCPPCRLMDAVITKAVEEEKLLDSAQYAFFEVDVDEQKGLAAKWHNDGIPFCVFYWNGTQVLLDAASDRHDRVVDGGLCGGLGKAQLVALAKQLYAAAKAGKKLVALSDA